MKEIFKFELSDGQAHLLFEVLRSYECVYSFVAKKLGIKNILEAHHLIDVMTLIEELSVQYYFSSDNEK